MSRLEQKVRVATMSLGKGVFSLKRFKEKQIIGEVTGIVIDDPDYGSEYCLDMGHGRLMEPGEPFRFLNHSCDPNCQVFFYEDAGKPAERLYLQALTLVLPGEQLTIDYAWPADSAIPCACKSANCRGWVVSLDELDDVLEREQAAIEIPVEPIPVIPQM